MDALSRLGFRKGWTYESIVSTVRGSEVSSASIGVLSSDLQSLSLEVYKTGRTSENMKKGNVFTVSFPSSVDVFFRVFFEGDSLEYEPFGDDAFSLKCAPAALKARVSKVEDLGEKLLVAADVVDFRMTASPRLFNRAEALAFESLIAHSKLAFVSDKEKEFLEEKIAENVRLIRKLAPGSGFEELVQGLSR